MFKSQKLIVFSILLALVGIGTTVVLGIGISVRDSVNPDKSSAATINKTTDYTGRVSCLTSGGTTYTKSNLGMIKLTLGAYDETNNKVINPNVKYTSSISKDGYYSIGGSAPIEYSHSLLEVSLSTGSNTIEPVNCLLPEKLVSTSGIDACLNTLSESPSICSNATNYIPVSPTTANVETSNSKYLCERNIQTTTYNGFDFEIKNCPEPILDLSTTAIDTSTTISKNTGDTLTMYFSGEDLSDYNTINTKYYFGEQGLSNIYSSFKVYYCNSSSDTDCSSEVLLATVPPEVSVSPWKIIAVTKNKKIKIEGKLLSTAKSNQTIKIQFAQLPSSLLPLLNDSNSANNVWTGSVSIVAPAVTVTPPVVTPPVVNPPVVTSSTGTRTTTTSSRRSSSSNGSAVSDTSSTESTISSEASSSEESNIDTEESTSTKSTSSIKPYIPANTTSSSDNNTLLLALVCLLVLFLISLFVVYRKYKSDQKSKEVFNTPTSETGPTIPTV